MKLHMTGSCWLTASGQSNDCREATYVEGSTTGDLIVALSTYQTAAYRFKGRSPCAIGVGMHIDLESHAWGEAIPSNVAALLADVASHLNRLLVEPVSDHVIVVPASGPDAVPRTLYRYSAYGPFTIQLTARDRRWSKFAYQFSHELCT